MRRFIAFVLAAFVALASFPRAEAATYWQLVEEGNRLAEAGKAEEALPYWLQAIPMIIADGNKRMAGYYAQQVAYTLDELGRSEEALPYYEMKVQFYRETGVPDEQMRWDILRIEQLKPRLEVFVARPTAGVKPGDLAKHEPAFGALYGGTVDHDPAVYDDLDRAAATYGKPYGMVMVYNSVAEYDYLNVSSLVLEKGVPLQIAWQPTRGLQSVTEPVVRAYARKLAEYGQPVFLRFGNEMNGNWVPWYGNPELYKEKFRLVARIMREEAPNVAMVWAPNFVGADYMPYYPGDEWVDWVGVSAYHDAYFLADVNQSDMTNGLYYQGQKANPLDKFKEIYERFADRKPIMIAETGYNYSNDTPEARRLGLPIYDASEWAAQTARYVYAYLPMVYPRIKMVGHFNNPRTGDKAAYTMSQNRTLLNAVREAIADDWYLSSLDQVPENYWHPIEQATLHGKTRVASYVWLGDRGLGKVEYRLDGRLVATSHKVPYVADIDLSGLTGKHVLTVQAYDKSGRLAAERSYTFDASSVKVKLDGRVLDFARQPVNENGRILVPFRAIAEALGAEVQWNAQTRTAIARKGGIELRLTIDDPVPVLNGKRMEPLQTPARNVDGHTMVPARVFAEAFGMTVDWDGRTQTVLIQSPASAAGK
ncbi:stalk domain-containing protein [Symbiobacterium thermophilum]|uniref:stalk domain-containing protein n=1 Tax=Symbiobacterium thermophilum TaxID=2734 RepID=UPI002353BD04|nr:stalk domain-containing protein [Symbiobacterium thermophilum]